MVGSNTGVGQAVSGNRETANPQQIGAQALQLTGPLQGASASANVLGVSDVLRSPNASPSITVEGSDGSNATNATQATAQKSQEPPLDPNTFVFSPWLIAVVVIALVIGAVWFVSSQRQSHNFRD